MRKPAFSICKNKGADQLHSNCAADQRLCFHYIESTIPLLPESEITSLLQSSVDVQAGLCRMWLESPKTAAHLIIKLIRITHPCVLYPLTPHFYIVKLGFTGVYIIFLFLRQNIDCGYSLELPH